MKAVVILSKTKLIPVGEVVDVYETVFLDEKSLNFKAHPDNKEIEWMIDNLYKEKEEKASYAVVPASFGDLALLKYIH